MAYSATLQQQQITNTPCDMVGVGCDSGLQTNKYGSEIVGKQRSPEWLRFSPSRVVLIPDTSALAHECGTYGLTMSISHDTVLSFLSTGALYISHRMILAHYIALVIYHCEEYWKILGHCIWIRFTSRCCWYQRTIYLCSRETMGERGFWDHRSWDQARLDSNLSCHLMDIFHVDD